MSRKCAITLSVVGLFLLVLAFNLIWNAVVPNVLGFKPVNYLEALGLMIIARLLFGGFGRHFNHLGLLGRWRGLSHKDRDSIMSFHGFCHPRHHYKGGDGHGGYRHGECHDQSRGSQGYSKDQEPSQGLSQDPSQDQGSVSKAGEDSGPKPNND